MDHSLLISELQSLITESKRRHPDVREASEHALEILKVGKIPKEVLASKADELLAPVTLGCKTKNAKVVGISIGALQRLVALGGVPTASLPDVLQTLSVVSGQAVDIQLKILQTLLSILTYIPDIHDDVLGNALLLCFKLHESRVSVVSSTAAATLRQAVMIVFDRTSSDDANPMTDLVLPSEPPRELKVNSSAMDAFNIFSDLCLLTGGGGGGSGFLWSGGDKQKPRLLRLGSLQRTFGLELIESVLSGYEEGVRKRPELLFLLECSLAPLLLRLLTEKPSFPTALRVCRLMFLLVRSFTELLPSQAEACLTTLLRLGTGEHEMEEASKKETVPAWLRVLALEVLRGICLDFSLLQKIWSEHRLTAETNLFAKLVTSLGHLINERPALMGIGVQMHGLGVQSTESQLHGLNTAGAGGYLDKGMNIVTTAANAGLTTVSSMMHTGVGGLGSHSSLKLRLIEQHDKADAPAIPDTYPFLLALQSLDAIAEGIYLASAEHAEDSSDIQAMAESAWPALLAALSYCIVTNLSDVLFSEVLSALQNFTIACGLLSLTTPRNAFINILGKFAVPPPVVSAMQSQLEAPPLARNNSVINADSLGLGALGVGGPPVPPGLSERNLACLKSIVTTARILASSLGDAWHDILEVLQNANFMLSTKRPSIAKRPTIMQSPLVGSGPPSPGRSKPTEKNEQRSQIFDDIDTDAIQSAVNDLFDASRDLKDSAFTTFISALCKLSSEMIGMDATNSISTDLSNRPSVSPVIPSHLSNSDAGRRRTSGINISHVIKTGERSFSLTKLRSIAMVNLTRLVQCDPQVGWAAITQHLLAVSRHLTAPATIRMQASDTLSELLSSAVRIGKDVRIQHQVFDVLVRQVDQSPVSNNVAIDYDVRAAGYQSLNQILESSGHSLEVGWQTIFGMLNAVCKEPKDGGHLRQADSQISLASATGSSRPSTFTKGDVNLVRIAFPSLNLICTDFLSSLDHDPIRQCIACLGYFGRQREDVNITLAAVGLMWNVSDAVQVNSKELWLDLLTELLELGRGPRLEVRSSAMQTLFRCIELYGSSLSPELWENVLWKIIFPLLDAAQGDEGSVLALTSVGSIFSSFLARLAFLPSFDRMTQRFLDRVRFAFMLEPRDCTTAGLKSLERVLITLGGLRKTQPAVSVKILQSTWSSFSDMGNALTLQGEPYTQDNLVALVSIASLLHQLLDWDGDRMRDLSTILRSIMTYTRSPEYRPDVDVMSPLQTAVTDLIGSSTSLPSSLVLSDLAEFATLAYFSDQSTKLTYIALSKHLMPRIAKILQKHTEQNALYQDGTIEAIIGVYSIPIKLKYDCPPSNRYGDDPPLWKTAISTFTPVLESIMPVVEAVTLEAERCEAIWGQILAVFGGLLLADISSQLTDEGDEAFVLPFLNRIKVAIIPRLVGDRVSEVILQQLADILRKASVLYYLDNKFNGGTTAPVIPESSEEMRYWALDLLVAVASRTEPVEGTAPTKLAQFALAALIKRFEEPMRQMLHDTKLTGQMPLGQVREDELLYILRRLATLRVASNSMVVPHDVTLTLSMAYATSSRAHLFHFYPLLLELSFSRCLLPSMWIFPAEHAKLFSLPEPNRHADGEFEEVDAGDGGGLIEVNARDIARRCLEMIGEEMGLS